MNTITGRIVRDDLPRQWNCNRCGYGEYAQDPKRAARRAAEHTQYCQSLEHVDFAEIELSIYVRLTYGAYLENIMAAEGDL